MESNLISQISLNPIETTDKPALAALERTGSSRMLPFNAMGGH